MTGQERDQGGDHVAVASVKDRVSRQGVSPPGHSSKRPARAFLLDLFCGAGGCSVGYNRAGFDVSGVDIAARQRYPFPFFQADALVFLRTLYLEEWPDTYLLPHRPNFDAIHASPPCQHYSDLAGRNGNADEHPDLIGPVRELLQATGLPYIIENVEGSPLIDPVTICGTTLGLGVDGYRLRRHRCFETNFPLVVPACQCAGDHRPVIDVTGGGPTYAPRLDGGGGRTYKGTVAQKRGAMGIPWMIGAELVEAIPPAYTELIGAQLLAALDTQTALPSPETSPDGGRVGSS